MVMWKPHERALYPEWGKVWVGVPRGCDDGGALFWNSLDLETPVLSMCFQAS